MAEKKSPAKPKLTKAAPTQNTLRDRVMFWLVVVASVAMLWLLFANSTKEKPLNCDGSNGGNLTSFGSCR
jgi:hypothetical protein